LAHPGSSVYDGSDFEGDFGFRRLVAGSLLFRCSVCVGELTYAFGRLDPAHADTAISLRFMPDILGGDAPSLHRWLMLGATL